METFQWSLEGISGEIAPSVNLQLHQSWAYAITKQETATTMETWCNYQTRAAIEIGSKEPPQNFAAAICKLLLQITVVHFRFLTNLNKYMCYTAGEIDHIFFQKFALKKTALVIQIPRDCWLTIEKQNCCNKTR